MSSKKDLIYSTLRDLKAAQYAGGGHESMRISEITTTKSGTLDESVTTATMTTSMDDPGSFMITAPVSFSTNLLDDEDEENQKKKKPESFPEKPRKSEECEQGWRIPEAEGIEWTDGYFDGDVKNLVAVFDHHYDMLMRYFVKVALLTNVSASSSDSSSITVDGIC